MATYKKLRPLMVGDFYPLVPHNESESQWYGYLEDGKRIDLEKVVSYFGPFSLHVESKVNSDRIHAGIEFPTDRRPKRIELRLPHPQGRKAVWVKGGTYDPKTERVAIEPFNGRADVTLGFGPEG